MGYNFALFQQAATELRAVEATLSSVVSDLHGSETWAGKDSDKFQNEWNSLVTARLLSAAQALERAQFVEM